MKKSTGIALAIGGAAALIGVIIGIAKKSKANEESVEAECEYADEETEDESEESAE